MPTWYTAPPWWLAIIFVVVGFYALIKGADILVIGGVQVAKRFDLSPAVIGATVVAFGTSLPELVVSLGSNIKALQLGQTGADGPAAIALGNVIGSNIFNIGAILGITALVRPLAVPRSTFRLDFPLMLLAFTMLIVFSIIGEGAAIGRGEGLILFCGLIGFTVLAIRTGQVDVQEVVEHDRPVDNVWAGLGLVIAGAALLCVAGDVSLSGALAISRAVGMSERVIGLTVMALGTSLPELATSIQAVRRGHGEMALGNVVGSNIFNVFCIVGIAAMVIPIPVNAGNLGWDYWWMGGFALLLLPLLITQRALVRWEGALLLVALLSYIGLLLVWPELGSG